MRNILLSWDTYHDVILIEQSFVFLLNRDYSGHKFLKYGLVLMLWRKLSDYIGYLYLCNFAVCVGTIICHKTIVRLWQYACKKDPDSRCQNSTSIFSKPKMFIPTWMVEHSSLATTLTNTCQKCNSEALAENSFYIGCLCSWRFLYSNGTYKQS